MGAEATGAEATVGAVQQRDLKKQRVLVAVKVLKQILDAVLGIVFLVAACKLGVFVPRPAG